MGKPAVIIDFHHAQIQKFLNLAQAIVQAPEQYIQFDHVSDFYKAAWLQDFPHTTTWYVTGLDDGAEDFYISIQFENYHLNIQAGSHVTAVLTQKD